MDKKLKVCHISSSHSSRDGRIFDRQCKSLANYGFEVYYLNRFDSFEEGNVKVIGKGLTRSLGKTKSKFKLLNKARKITKMLYEEALALNCDIYQIHDPELLFTAYKLKKKGKIVIFDSHENYSDQYKIGYNAIIAKAYTIIETFILKRIDGVIFPCEKNGENIFEGKCKHTLILENYPKLEELYNKYRENNEKMDKSICYVGGLTKARGIKELTEASYKADAKLILGGRFTPITFEKEIRNMKEFECIEEKGVVNREGILNILQQSIIGASTLLNHGQYNKFDNFPTKVYEYMSLGLPVILTDYNYARKINEKYNFAILINPEDIDDIAKAITTLLNDNELVRKLGLNGREAIRQEFNWGVEEKKLIEFYNKLIL